MQKKSYLQPEVTIIPIGPVEVLCYSGGGDDYDTNTGGTGSDMSWG